MTEEVEYTLARLREELDFTLYRGTELRTQTPILAVSVTAERPSPQNLRGLKDEYSLAPELEAAWAAQPLALTRHQGRTVLILKDPGGEPLDQVIANRAGQPIDLTGVLRTAIGLAAALAQVHGKGIIHKDIKPANALVDGTGQVWLTGFRFASKLRRERQLPVAAETIAGTLPYMAPEQTGRMNRSIDPRSDLYSLGVTLYQMLTGALPFAATDPLEWIHCHIAQQPETPADRAQVPAPLSAITMRLLAKNAEERYQSAAGLEADLRRCLSQWQLHGRIEPFPLGVNDASDRLLIPERLYGREREVDALLAAFKRVRTQGATEFVLVSGYSGIGKSSVANELHKVLVTEQGLFAAGKFDQYKRDVPYATLAQAFQMLVRQILVKSEAEVERWRGALVEALGSDGSLLVNLIPEVEFVIGKQNLLTELPAREARARFQVAFRRFLSVFARPEHPLVLFLDDLQWLDTATLELLESLTTDSQVRHVLLIGAYRDNEVSESHPLMRTLAAIRATGTKTQEILLKPLRLEDIERLVGEALRCHQSSADPLARLIHEKTGGNPFFAIQLLTSLAEEGLLRFDRDATAWVWDLGRIRAKGYSDNVVDLMVEKLRRLSDTSQTALQQLACLGNSAEVATLSVVFGKSEGEIHDTLLEAVGSGLILRLEGSYAFLHDRIQEAAYALIPESARVDEHLRIGRQLLARSTAESPSDQLFDLANQLNRGARGLADHDEKMKVAAVDQRAGRKAKQSAAYAAARSYFEAGTALLEEADWSRDYDLVFGLWLERVESELLTGHVVTAEELIERLLSRAKSIVDAAAVCCLKVQLHLMKQEPQQAVATALRCLRGFGIDLSEHPNQEQVEAEYAAVQHALNGRSLESLIDLPLLSDPELQAATKVLAVLFAPAFMTDSNLACVQTCRLVQIGLQHGPSSASVNAYATWMSGPGWVFHRYDQGYRFATFACDLVEKHDFTASGALAYGLRGNAAFWTQSISTAIEFLQKGIRAAREGGDPTYGFYLMYADIACRILRNDPLEQVWRESEIWLDSVRKAKLGDLADMLVSQQRFIAKMQGCTRSVSTFSDSQFDEAAFEAGLTGPRMPPLLLAYWSLKLEARFLSGDLADALAAADSAKLFLKAVPGQIPQLNYCYYTALTVSALYESASAEQQQEWVELLRAHRAQLREWAESYPPTFADKHALVSAEIARLEKRDADSMTLYEQAIHSAHENGFLQNEGLAQELAAQYCLARGIETAGYFYLRNARNCYERWGAEGKVKQLEERYPRLRVGRIMDVSAAASPLAKQMDIETVVKASQAISGEVVLPKLVEQLMQIAVENAGAERGVLILLQGTAPRIEAEATTGRDRIEVAVRRAPVTPSDLLVSVLQYVIRTQERVLLDDASTEILYSQEAYVRRNRTRSVLCLPVVKQAKLLGALYLENNLTPYAFTPERVAVLALLASQAAISLENAALYSDLQLQVGVLQQLPVSAWTLRPDGTPDFVNKVWLEFAGQSLDFIRSHPEAWMNAVHPEDREAAARSFWDGVRSGRGFEIETRSLRAKDQTYRWHLQQAVALRDSQGKVLNFVGATTDIDDQKRAEEGLRQAQDDLARINRATTLGELAASVSHELSQPISGALTNANTCLRKLGSKQPDVDEIRLAITRLTRDVQRAVDIIERLRSQFRRRRQIRELIDVNEIHRETITLLRDEAVRNSISVRMELEDELPPIRGDRVQIQQVAMNLIINGIEAMSNVDGLREIVIRSRAESEQILVSVSDTGTGLPPQLAERIFDPFFTTKPNGTGMGLRICRSIIESHDGRLWAKPNDGPGTTFLFSLPRNLDGVVQT